MRKTKQGGSFAVCLLINMLLNFEGLIPAAVLAAMYFIFDLPILWAVLAAALWIAWIIFWMFIVGWAGSCAAAADKQKENKNPYSAAKKEDNGNLYNKC